MSLFSLSDRDIAYDYAIYIHICIYINIYIYIDREIFQIDFKKYLTELEIEVHLIESNMCVRPFTDVYNSN